MNDKEIGRYRLLFRAEDIDAVKRDDSWVKLFGEGRIYGDQWYLVRLDRVHIDATTDSSACEAFGEANGCKVHNMRWLGKTTLPMEGEVGRDKVYRSMVIYLDASEEADRLVKEGVALTRGESAFTHPWIVGQQPLTNEVLENPLIRRDVRRLVKLIEGHHIQKIQTKYV